MTNAELKALVSGVRAAGFAFEVDDAFRMATLTARLLNVIDTDLPYKITSVILQRTVDQHTFSRERVIVLLHEMCSELLLHELTETFRVNGERIYDPHPEIAWVAAARSEQYKHE